MIFQAQKDIIVPIESDKYVGDLCFDKEKTGFSVVFVAQNPLKKIVKLAAVIVRLSDFEEVYRFKNVQTFNEAGRTGKLLNEIEVNEYLSSIQDFELQINDFDQQIVALKREIDVIKKDIESKEDSIRKTQADIEGIEENEEISEEEKKVQIRSLRIKVEGLRSSIQEQILAGETKQSKVAGLVISKKEAETEIEKVEFVLEEYETIDTYQEVLAHFKKDGTAGDSFCEWIIARDYFGLPIAQFL